MHMDEQILTICHDLGGHVQPAGRELHFWTLQGRASQWKQGQWQVGVSKKRQRACQAMASGRATRFVQQGGTSSVPHSIWCREFPCRKLRPCFFGRFRF